jgi:hypothetical protein
MIDAGLISGGIGALGSLASIGIGLFQRAKARKLEKETVRPVYTTPSEIYMNQKLAQKNASQGMDGTTYNTQLNNINRNVSSGLDAIGKQRNGLAGIGNIVANASDASLNLAAQDDAVKKANLQGYMIQNQNVADYEDKAFQYNKADKYAETMQKISQMRATGNAGINSGINGVTSIAQSYMNTQQVGNSGTPKPTTGMSLKDMQSSLSKMKLAR